MTATICTFKEKPQARAQVGTLTEAVWPRFMMESEVADRAWPLLFDAFADFQLAMCDEEDHLLALANAVPLAWDGTLGTLPEGWDAATQQAIEDYEAGRTVTALSAYQIVVAPEQQGKGYSSLMLAAIKLAARKQGMHSVIACVRPTLKAIYPLTPIERYAQWKQPDGTPFDPWLRVHWRAGAEQLHASPESMLIRGTVAEWEDWTGLRFPESGPYVVPGALEPIVIDCENNTGRYNDPNIWMWHRMAG